MIQKTAGMDFHFLISFSKEISSGVMSATLDHSLYMCCCNEGCFMKELQPGYTLYPRYTAAFMNNTRNSPVQHLTLRLLYINIMPFPMPFPMPSYVVAIGMN